MELYYSLQKLVSLNGCSMPWGHGQLGQGGTCSPSPRRQSTTRGGSLVATTDRGGGGPHSQSRQPASGSGTLLALLPALLALPGQWVWLQGDCFSRCTPWPVLTGDALVLLAGARAPLYTTYALPLLGGAKEEHG